MSKFALVNALRANDAAKGKKATNYFDCNASVISYSTGFPVLDYYLGYKVNVCDEDGKLLYTYPSLGITAGSLVVFIGKPSTSKTAAAVKIASNIVRNFDNGFIMHFDLEQAMNYSRIQALTKLPMNDMKQGKYILRQEKTTLEDMKATIMQVYREKVSNPKEYKYDTGLKNEFNENIIVYEPTVIIIDSIASITMSADDGSAKSLEKLEEISTQTERMRLTGEIGRFFNEILPYCKEANITIIAINQIKANAQISIIKSASLLLGLKQDEAVPGGLGPLFLSHILLKFVAIGSEKYSDEDDGFEGFKVRVEVIKSRVSAALRSCNVIYNKNTGISMVRSSVDYANDLGLIGGNRNGYYFLSDTEKKHKFTLKNMPEDFRNDPELYKILKDNIIPSLEKNLSGITPEELEIPDEEINFYNI